MAKSLPPPIVSDTGFLLSLASTRLLLPVLRVRWEGRVILPREVHSELVHRIKLPGNGVSTTLAKRALDCGLILANIVTDLSVDQKNRAQRLATAIGGTATRHHAGEAAAAILARDLGGLIACEDRQAARVIKTREGVGAISVRDVLMVLCGDGSLARDDAVAILSDLRRHGRPNVGDLTMDDVG